MLLANNLIEKIQSGRYKPGALLPSEAELCEQFSVSRITVRGALQQLEQKGLVSRKAGVGTRVEEQKSQAVFTHQGDSIDEILQFTRGFPAMVISRAEIVISEKEARALNVRVGQRMVKLVTVRQKAGLPPVVFSTHFIPALLAPEQKATNGLKMSLAQLIADANGDEVMSIKQEIRAVRLGKAEAGYLQCKPGATALRSDRWYFGRNDHLLLVTTSVFPGDRYVFASVLHRSRQSSH